MASKRFSLDFDIKANIGPVKDALQKFQKLLKNTTLNIPVDIKGGMEGTLAKLETEIQSFEKTAAQGFSSMSEIRTAERSFGKIQYLMSQLSNQALKLGTIDFDKFLPKETQERTKNLLNQLKELEKLQSDSSSAKNIAAQNKELEKQRKKIAQIQEKQQKKNAAAEARSAPDWKQIEAEYNRIVEAEKRIKELESQIESVPRKKPQSQKALKDYEDKQGRNAARRRQIAQERLMPDENGEFRQVESKTYTQYKKRIIDRYKAGIDTVPETSAQLAGQLEEAFGKITEIEQRSNSFNSAFNENLSRFRENLSKLSGISLDELPADLEGLKQVILNLSANNIEDVQKALLQLTSGASGLNGPLQNAKKGLQDFGREFETASRAAEDAARLKNQLFDFFSISNTIHIFKNTIREAFNTVRELDAVMTETAVVTDFTVGDMWEKLPEYAEQATKLGSSIKSLYEATTLYYQQGLNSEQAMSVGSETMKMARIANMDAADATEAMTAALRGFNMEIDQTSATRVNDVYSELAAITAADTSQIATAMTKTASIAASANMEFETTAAFLAQIIETTQEAPETAGTAMKTIIARFTEVKELFDEGMLTGEDEEGEAIEINKIDAALKSVGISLREFLLGSKGIDDIFLELASKWDSLDLATQRYIATTAAGSRQQSRFIAMMSDYERTMELVTAANNSAGAGQKQFDKTLESLDSKLQRLSNAWQQFTMNLANSTVIKAGVDFLSGLLETINKLIEAMSGGNGLVASFVTLGTVIGALKTGNALLTGKNTFGKLFNRMGFQTKEQTEAEGGPVFRKPFSYQSPESKGFAYGIYSGFGRLIGGKDYKTRLILEKELAEADWALQAKQRESSFIQGVAPSTKKEEERKKKAEQALEDLNSRQKSLQKAQVAADGLTLAGGAANVIAIWAESKGYEKISDGLSAVGTTAMVAGQGISFMNNVLDVSGMGWGDLLTKVTGFGKALTGLAPVALPVIAGLATAAVALQIAWELSPEGQLADAVKRTEQTAEGAKNASDSYNNLQVSLKNIENQASAIENMTRNTQEWNNAVNQMNQDIDDLISKNEELAEAAFYEDGILKLDKSKVNEYMRQEELDVVQAKNAELNARILEEQARQKTYGINEFLTGQEGVYDKYGSQRVEDLTMQLAQAVADGKVYDEETAEKWAQEFGENIEVKLDEDSLNNLREYGNILNESNSKIEGYETQMGNNIKTMAKTQGTLTDFASGLDDSIVAGLRDSEYDKAYDKILGDMGTIALANQNAQKYAKLMGYASYEGTSFNGYDFKTADGKTVSANAIVIAQALASEQADEAAVENLSKIEEVFGQNAAEVLSQDGISMTNESIAQLGQVFGENAQGNESDKKKLLAQQFGYENYEDMAAKAAAIGLNMDELYNTMAENYESAVDRITKQRTDLVTNMSKYSQYRGGEGDVKDSAAFLAYLEQQLGEGIRGTLEGVFDSVSRSGDDNLISEVYDRFSTVASNDAIRGTENYKNLSNLITGIDWSNPISAASVLNDKLQTGDAISKDFAKNVLQMGHNFLGAGSQMRYLAQSSEFSDIKEDLNEILETSSEISASDVYDLAESYDSLDEILENTGVSAAAVGKVLEKIASGKMDIHQLTDSVLAALSGFGDLDSMIAGLNKRVSNFDPGISEAFAADFLGQAHESITALLEEGAYGNAQIGKYYDFIFGSDWSRGANGEEMIGQERMNAIKQYNKFLGQNSTNMKASWLELINKGQIAGNEVAAGEEGWRGALEARGMAIRSNGKEIFIDNFNELTTSEMVNAMSEVLGISKTLAEMMLTDYKEHSADESVMRQNEIDAEAAAQNIRDLAQEKGYISSDGQGDYFLDRAEIQAMADGLGLEYQTMLNALKTTFGETALQITDFYNEQGNLKSPEEAYDYWTGSKSEGGLGQEDIGNYKDFRADSGGVRTLTPTFDLAQMEKDIAKSNLPEAVQRQITQGATEAFISQQNGQPYEINMRMSDGSVQTIKVQAGQSLEDAYAQAEKNNEQNLIANAIKAAFSGENAATLNVEIKANEGDIVGQIASIQGTTIPVGAEFDREGLVSQVSSITATISVTGKYTGTDGLPMRAKGIKNSPTDHSALVGEKGPELIERNDGTAYLSGVDGPEVTAIQKGETVHTAQETKKILRGHRGINMPRFENSNRTTTSSYGNTTVSGGKGAGGSGKGDLENPFDKLYNLVREIDEELRQRERIERRYEKLLESINENANQIIAVSREQLAQLEYEQKLQEKLVEGRKEQIKLYQKEKEELNKYGWVEENSRGESVLRIDWDAIDAITSQDEMGKVEEYVGQLEEWFDSLNEAEDALMDIEDSVAEIKERGAEEYDDLEKAISEGLADIYQKEIDKLDEINSSINETNASLLEAVQDSIEKQRQDRENEKTEEQLAERQRRLAYLSQDTSGANQLEILKLQKEIAEGQEDYTDTLIDQKISELQKQNSEAEKQREQQIALLQAQLDHFIESGEIWREVYALMDEGLDKEEGLVRGSRLEEILKDADNFAGLSAIGQMEWWTDMNGMIAQALAYLEVGRQLEDIGVAEGITIEFKNEAGELIKGTVDAQGNVVTDSGFIYDNVFQGADGKYYAGKNIKSQDELKPKPPKVESVEPDKKEETATTGNTASPYRYKGLDGNWYKTEAEKQAADRRWNELQQRATDGLATDGSGRLERYRGLDGVYYSTLAEKNAADERWKKLWQKLATGGGGSTRRLNAKFATGGLADFTGPAWLDGTKARPELVLNARDTQNFIQLKDILSSVLNRNIHPTTSTENNGDITYDIDINVESVSNDYDVEKIASKVKSLINNNARYRNNNTVNLRR